MNLVVGSARIDENERAYGGASGDQTGKEVCTQVFYVHSKGWNVLRPKSVEHANKLAERMLAACNNNNIGYNQSNRLGVIKCGIDTKTKTACDCSSLVRQCVIEACGVDAGNFVTATEVAALQATGLFDVSKYKSGDILYNGDILVTCTSGHTVIVVSGNPRKNNNKSYEEIAKEVIDGLWGNGDERKSRIEAAGYNYDEVQSRVNVLINSNAKPTVSKVYYYAKYSGGSSSIAEALKSIGVDSSYKNRKSIAVKNGIKNYSGTAAQNIKLLKLLKEGKLIK